MRFKALRSMICGGAAAVGRMKVMKRDSFVSGSSSSRSAFLVVFVVDESFSFWRILVVRWRSFWVEKKIDLRVGGVVGGWWEVGVEKNMIVG